MMGFTENTFWNPKNYLCKIPVIFFRIFFFFFHNTFDCRCARVVTETVAKLRDAGHEMVPFHIPNIDKAAAIFYQNIMPDNGQYILGIYRNEVIPPSLKTLVFLLRVSFCTI